MDCRALFIGICVDIEERYFRISSSMEVSYGKARAPLKSELETHSDGGSV